MTTAPSVGSLREEAPESAPLESSRASSIGWSEDIRGEGWSKNGTNLDRPHGTRAHLTPHVSLKLGTPPSCTGVSANRSADARLNAAYLYPPPRIIRPLPVASRYAQSVHGVTKLAYQSNPPPPQSPAKSNTPPNPPPA